MSAGACALRCVDEEACHQAVILSGDENAILCVLSEVQEMLAEGNSDVLQDKEIVSICFPAGILLEWGRTVGKLLLPY